LEAVAAIVGAGLADLGALTTGADLAPDASVLGADATGVEDVPAAEAAGVEEISLAIV
jgi:hypothetical protein